MSHPKDPITFQLSYSISYMSFLNQLIDSSRLLTVLHDNLDESVKGDKLYDDVSTYLEKYTTFNNISPEVAEEIYTNYITHYNKHCKNFCKTLKYPIESGITNYSVSREEYDIVLLLSVLFTPHRFKIMQLLHNGPAAEKALFIGLGPGLEIFITKEKFKEIHAYDLSVNKFLFSEFPEAHLNIELYTGQNKNYFDSIYLIELLEHLEDPYELLAVCYGSLKKGGKIILTTATDIPQFDHLYNFPKDHRNFEERVTKLGFKVIFKEEISHNYLTMELKPFNHFYTLEKI